MLPSGSSWSRGWGPQGHEPHGAVPRSAGPQSSSQCQIFSLGPFLFCLREHQTDGLCGHGQSLAAYPLPSPEALPGHMALASDGVLSLLLLCHCRCLHWTGRGCASPSPSVPALLGPPSPPSPPPEQVTEGCHPLVLGFACLNSQELVGRRESGGVCSEPGLAGLTLLLLGFLLHVFRELGTVLPQDKQQSEPSPSHVPHELT